MNLNQFKFLADVNLKDLEELKTESLDPLIGMFQAIVTKLKMVKRSQWNGEERRQYPRGKAIGRVRVMGMDDILFKESYGNQWDKG